MLHKPDISRVSDIDFSSFDPIKILEYLFLMLCQNFVYQIYLMG